MPVVVLNQGTAQHSAPVSEWQSLQSDLQGQTNGHYVYLNELGENTTVPLSTIVRMIENGAVWVDYCGWPFWGVSSGAFSDFLQLMGMNIPNVSFFTSGDMYDNYPRSLSMHQPFPSSFVVNTLAFHTNFYNILTFSPLYVAASFAIKYGKGAYVYAFGNDGQKYGFLSASAGDQGVPVANYASFIQSILASLPAPNSTGQDAAAPAPSSGSSGYGSGGSSYPSPGNGYPSSNGGGGSSVSGSYPTVNATVNGTAVSAYAVNGNTYLNQAQTQALGVQWNSNATCQPINGQEYCNYDGANPPFKVTGGAGNWQFTYTGGGLFGGLGSNASKWLLMGGVALGALAFWQYTTRRGA